MFEALPDGWLAHRPEYHLEDRRWHVTARDYRPRKRTRLQIVESVGLTDEKALRDLAGPAQGVGGRRTGANGEPGLGHRRTSCRGVLSDRPIGERRSTEVGMSTLSALRGVVLTMVVTACTLAPAGTTPGPTESAGTPPTPGPTENPRTSRPGDGGRLPGDPQWVGRQGE